MNRRTSNPGREGSLRDDTRGAVYVEFLVAFIPFFIMVLGIMQIALMYSAHLIVQHAATAAARSAIVVFPDCEYRYGGAPQNVVNGGGTATDPVGALGSLFGGGGGGGGGLGLPGGSNSGARLSAVRFAANLPLAATSPSLAELTNDASPQRQSIIDAIGGGMNPAARLALGALAYNNAAMAVTFPRRPTDRSFRDNFGARDQLTARVTYLFHCGVPIVNKMACDDALGLFTGLPHRQLRQATQALRSGRNSLAEIQSVFERVQVAQNRLAAARPGLDELSHTSSGAVGSALLLGLTGGNFSVLRAEATLPNQGPGNPIPSACYRDR